MPVLKIAAIHKLLWVLLFGRFLLGAAPRVGETSPWKEIEEGLSVAQFESPRKSSVGDSTITVVRIDPKQFELRLLCAKQLDKKRRTAKQWRQEYGLVCVTNAGMFQADELTHVSYMKNFEHVNNKARSKDKCYLAFNRVDESVPPVQIIDTQYQDLKALAPKYHTLIQNIRAVSARQENVWSPQPRIWSMSLLAIDKDGAALFIFTRSPYSTHDFIEILLRLPLAIHNAMYLDGGPVAALSLAAGEFELELNGGYETGVRENNWNWPSYPIPNAIGVARKKTDKD